MATVPVHPVFLNDTEKAQNDTINDRKGDRKGDADEDIITLCKEKGLKAPEYHQEEDFRVVIWRKGDPEAIQG